MTESKIVEYNTFLLNKDNFGNFYTYLNPEVIIEPMELVADFCLGSSPPPKRGVNQYLNDAKSAINKVANDLTNLINNKNSGRGSGSGGSNDYAGAYANRGNNQYCDSEGNCYYCNEPPIDNNFDNCTLFSKSDIDSKNKRIRQSYIIGDGNEARLGTIGINTSDVSVIEGLSTVKTNTGAYERYLNMTQIYDNVLLDAMNLGIGIIGIIGVIQIIRP